MYRRWRKRAMGTALRTTNSLDTDSKGPVAVGPQRAGKLRVFNLWAKRAASPEPPQADTERDDADAVLALAASLRKTMQRMGLPVDGLRAALPQILQDMEDQETLPGYDG
ncbi:hypothetical protein AURDEDRAFT_159994 [Auricularia subglabra TFB-10046 SS5]|nr:hypothetical protein AURDEDRAFT_159994 [Auricularia subglabra TFB-10046 SS5]